MGLLFVGKIGLSSLLTAIVLRPAFYQIHLNYISVDLFGFNLLSSDIGVAGGGRGQAGGRGGRNGFHQCVRVSVRPKVCVRNSSGRISCSDMKWCMWFWMFDSIIFDRVKALLDLEFPPYKSLCSQLLRDASSDFLETLQVYLLWYEDVGVILDFGFDYFDKSQPLWT